MAAAASAPEYQLYKTQLPEKLFTDMKMYSVKVRKEMKLREIVSDAIEKHIARVKAGEVQAVVPEVKNTNREEWVIWTIHVEKDVYKDARKLGIDVEEDMFEILASAFSEYLRTLH